MDIKVVYEKLLQAKRPIDFFGEVSSDTDLKRIYRTYAKKIHPDTAPHNDKYIASQAIILLNDLYNLGAKELKDGIYSFIDPIKLYKHMSPLFEVKIKGELYEFYENVFEGEVANIFKGISNNNIFSSKHLI